jgi:hypothetical protein
MKKPAIPPTSTLPLEIARVIEPIKANVEIMSGARPGSTALTALPSAASLSDVITQLNAILSRINQAG